VNSESSNTAVIASGSRSSSNIAWAATEGAAAVVAAAERIKITMCICRAKRMLSYVLTFCREQGVKLLWTKGKGKRNSGTTDRKKK
jgi:hypothetical protein